MQGKPLQGCCIAGEGNEEVAVSREGTGRRDQLQKEATGLTHRIKSPELLPGRSVINPQGSGGSGALRKEDAVPVGQGGSPQEVGD